MSTFCSFEASSCSTGNETRHNSMKQFINAVRDFAQTRAEDTATLINRHLQILSATIDLSLFDPHTSVVSEFFVSLHQLLSLLEPRSALAWSCVNVLSTCCKNSAARVALIHTYQFLPPLSRLLGDHLSLEKKIRLLTLMQELTCGIRISWQIPHLSHLMATLTRWVNSGSDDIIALSLAVLVNLCYKNLPAIYTLSRCVDMKKFMKSVMGLVGIRFEVHICKLLIILEHMYGKVPQESLLKLTGVTFKSMGEAFRAKDNILLRHVIEFFLDIKLQPEQENFLLHYDKYDAEVENLLTIVENNVLCSGDTINSDPECVSLVLQFLHMLVEQKLPKMVLFYSRITTISLQWIHNEVVSAQALSILQAISVNLDSSNAQILEPMLPKLPIFLVELEHKSEDTPRNVEYNKKLSSLMELLASLVQVDSLREKVMSYLTENHMHKVFMPILGDPTLRKKNNDLDSMDTITVFANALVLITEMSRYDEDWFRIHRDLLQHKQIHILIAQALYNSPEKVRSQVLQLMSLPTFPRREVAKAMVTIQPMTTQVEEKPNSGAPAQQLMDGFCFPNMSKAQSEKLDELLHKLRETLGQNNLFNVATSEVMELYEYKLSSMGHAERAAVASVEAASQRCIHQDHHIAQLTAELSRTRQLLFHAQQSQEETTRDRDSLLERNKEYSGKWEAEKGRTKVLTSQLAHKEKALQETEHALEETAKRLKEVVAEKSGLEEQVAYCKSVMQKLQDTLVKKEKAYEKKEEMLSKANLSIEHLKSQHSQLEQHLSQKEAELAKCKTELNDVSKHLINKTQILETITKLTNNGY